MKLAIGLIFALTLRAGSVVVVQSAAGTLHNTNATYVGQSFATPATGGPWNNITFSFVSGGSQSAVGTAFLFSQPLPNGVYPSTTTISPSMLSSTVASFLAMSTGISNGQYTFDSTVTLQPNTVYYLYENALVPAQSLSGGATVLGPNSCCTSYFAYSSTTGYLPPVDGASANFLVSGTPITSVPVPVAAPTLSGWGLIMCAIVLAGAGIVAERSIRSV